MKLKRIEIYLAAIGISATLGGLAVGAAGFDRLKDYVKLGGGVASTKTLEFDIGASPNPAITADSTGLISVTGGGFVPTGALMPFAGSSAPAGWLLANGTAVSRTTYSKLFAVIGTSYGVGNGSTTFNLPDGRSRYFIGLDSGSASNDALGETGGSASSAHTHSVTSNVTVATQPTFTVDSHTHGIAHVHQWGTSSSSGDLMAPHDQDESLTTFNGLTSGLHTILTPVSATLSGSGTGVMTQNVFSDSFFTRGVLSPPTGTDGSGARSSTASVNTTTRTASVALTNSAVTSGAASVTENRPPFQVANYIIKI